MSREELISLVDRIISAEDSEEVGDELVMRLQENVLDPEVITYIFYSTPKLTAEEVVDKALAYRPIAL
ncbi:hypothetical protein ACFT9I_10115 [Streptomyces sp. NPDC057137]|uniref:hypothetical protein n=1 Tax=Streptomyces sp. NPDC057137 TaxID=3346030 RepID=UPI003629984F